MATAALQEVQGTDTHGETDPSLPAMDIAANQMERLARGVGEAITGPASRLRDRVDGVIRSTNKRVDKLIEEIDRLRLDGRAANESLTVMSEGCETLVARMGEDIPPSITQLPRRRVNGQD